MANLLDFLAIFYYNNTIMPILKIAFHPDPILRQVASPIDSADFNAPWLAKLAHNMVETMISRDGIGLAAPQVSQSIRLIIVSTKTGPLIMINPELTKKSLLKDTDEEGCLSIPNTFGQVKRHHSVQVKFTELDGKSKHISAKGLLARVIQHEIDHLDGILFIDKAKKITDNNYTM
jgi:peptide deformylase